ncbi:MAG TPA: YncE family protein [Steroidobacteraceae bacterium]|jgi:YVTN family beta-propeller protein
MSGRQLAVSASLLGLALNATSTAMADSTPLYRVTQTVTLGAPDRWDYVVFDPPSKRVYVAHGDEVTVVDGDKGAILGHVKGLAGGTHGIAVVPGAKRGYTDDGEAGIAASFDLTTFAVQSRIKAAEDADAVAFDPVSGHVFVINGDGGTITVIDPKTNAGIGTIQGGGKLEYAVPDGKGKLYVNGAGKQEVLAIDTATNQVSGRFPVTSCTSPHGLAVDPQTRRLFVSCLNKLLMVVDADTGKVVAQIPIGAGSDAVAFDPKRKLIFSSNGVDGTLSIIREENAHTFTPVGDMKTALTARTMGIDPMTGRLYLAAADVATDAAASTPPAPPAQGRRRPKLVPGSLKLLFLDPTG